MIKLKVSYEKPAELSYMLNLLKGNINRFKKPKENVGRFKKAYIELSNEPTSNPEKSH